MFKASIQLTQNNIAVNILIRAHKVTLALSRHFFLLLTFFKWITRFVSKLEKNLHNIPPQNEGNYWLIWCHSSDVFTKFLSTHYSNIILKFNHVSFTDLLTIKSTTQSEHIFIILLPTSFLFLLYVILLLIFHSCFQQKIDVLSAIKIKIVHLMKKSRTTN